MKIAVIGMGHVGGVLGRRWAESGHHVTFGTRNPQDSKALEQSKAAGAALASPHEAVAGAEVVVLAVPWQAAPGRCRPGGPFR